MRSSLVGSEMCIRDSKQTERRDTDIKKQRHRRRARKGGEREGGERQRGRERLAPNTSDHGLESFEAPRGEHPVPRRGHFHHHHTRNRTALNFKKTTRLCLLTISDNCAPSPSSTPCPTSFPFPPSNFSHSRNSMIPLPLALLSSLNFTAHRFRGGDSSVVRAPDS